MIRNFLLAIVASMALAASATAQLSDQWKTLIRLTGKCQYQLFKELGSIPCSNSIKYGVLPNGRAMFMFGNDKTTYVLSGGEDRQPRLEDYYLSVDTVRILQGGQQVAEDTNMEGECHWRTNKQGNITYEIRCDSYDRAKGMGVSLYFDKFISVVNLLAPPPPRPNPLKIDPFSR